MGEKSIKSIKSINYAVYFNFFFKEGTKEVLYIEEDLIIPIGF